MTGRASGQNSGYRDPQQHDIVFEWSCSEPPAVLLHLVSVTAPPGQHALHHTLLLGSRIVLWELHSGGSFRHDKEGGACQHFVWSINKDKTLKLLGCVPHPLKGTWQRLKQKRPKTLARANRKWIILSTLDSFERVRTEAFHSPRSDEHFDTRCGRKLSLLSARRDEMQLVSLTPGRLIVLQDKRSNIFYYEQHGTCDLMILARLILLWM